MACRKIVRRLHSVVLSMAMLYPMIATNAFADVDDCDATNCIRVGSFNIELLGSNRKRSGQYIPKRNDAELSKLSNLISEVAKFDVVALQEINTGSDEWSTLRSLLENRGYAVAIEGTHSGRSQYLVILYNKNRVSLKPESAIEIDTPVSYDEGNGCRYEGLRKPVAAQFKSGEFDFILAAVHLKSKSSRGIPDWCPSTIRALQAKDLLEELTLLSDDTEEPDIILVGDFNARYNEESLKAFRDAGYHSQMNYRADGSGRYSYRKGSNSLIDHVMINPSITTEFVRNSGFVYLVEDQALRDHVRQLSDHMPIWSSFSSEKDED